VRTTDKRGENGLYPTSSTGFAVSPDDFALNLTSLLSMDDPNAIMRC